MHALAWPRLPAPLTFLLVVWGGVMFTHTFGGAGVPPPHGMVHAWRVALYTWREGALPRAPLRQSYRQILDSACCGFAHGLDPGGPRDAPRALPGPPGLPGTVKH